MLRQDVGAWSQRYRLLKFAALALPVGHGEAVGHQAQIRASARLEEGTLADPLLVDIAIVDGRGVGVAARDADLRDRLALR